MPGPGNDLIDELEVEAVTRVLRSGHLGRYGPDDDPSFGAEVLTFEKSIADLVGVRHSVAVNSGTSAIWILLSALGIGPGDEVIVPGFTFVASMSAIVYAGAKPVLAEVDDTFNLDPRDVESRITGKTKAILAVHMLGAPCDLDALSDIANRHGLLLIEDACQGFGGTYHGRRLGSIGVGGAFSFNIYKTITCGDGGMLVTDADDVYERCFALHDQGHLPLRRGVEVGQRPYLGLNLRMIELSAAVLNVQLSRLERILSTLRANKAALRAEIETTPGVTFRRLADPDGDVATHLVVTLPTADAATAVAAELGTKTLAKSGWHVYSNMEHLRSRRIVSGFASSVADYVAEPGSLPATDALLARSITLGIGVVDAGIGSAFGINVRSDSADIEQVAKRFRTAVERHVC
ncbi:MAG TPA: DegT/DnrJ/EryC1/StrS family aminotransferase [Ilumatobacteraceae bacterium]|nr:DegT/DnrJ/EryC1/StrS family aminotransferase [Ilumatobacteraceae bacterium]